MATQGLGKAASRPTDNATLNDAALAIHPGYVSGRWYGLRQGAAGVAGPAPVGGSLYFVPFRVKSSLVVSSIGFRQTTATSQNSEAFIYASDPVTKRPTGAPLVSTSSVATGAVAGVVTLPVPTPAPTLAPGWYWVALQVSGTTPFMCEALADAEYSRLHGASTLAILSSAVSTLVQGLSVTGTYSLPPTLTSTSTFTETTTAPWIAFLAGSAG